MNNFTFYSPTMFAFGQGEASRVGALVRQFGGSKVLLMAGERFRKEKWSLRRCCRLSEGGRTSLVRAMGRSGQSPQRQGV